MTSGAARNYGHGNSERLIEIYRKGKIAEAFRAFKKIYLEIVDEAIDLLENSSD